MRKNSIVCASTFSSPRRGHRRTAADNIGSIVPAGSKEVSTTSRVAKVAKSSRKVSSPGDMTRNKLLDAAEQIFSEEGYDGATLRDVAKAAEVHQALSTYHFGTKERLFDEVIARRAIEMERVRLQALEHIDPDAQGSSETVRLLIEAYVSPMIKARYGTSKHWKAHVRLMAGVVNLKRWSHLISKHYDRCARAYLERWRLALPGVDDNALLNAFSFMVVASLYVCSNTGRFAQWKTKATSHKEEVRLVTEDLVAFVHAGFMSLQHRKAT